MKLIKDILDSAKERLKNPLITAIIISWLFLHWKHISILFFSKLPIIDRICEIDRIEENIYWIILYWVLPFVIGLFYVVALPFIMAYIDGIIEEKVIKRKKSVFTILIAEVDEKQKLATKEINLEDSKSELKSKQELKIQIENLKEDIISKDSFIEELKTRIKNGTPKLDFEFKLINKILENPQQKKLFNDLINAENNDNFYPVTEQNKNDINFFLKNKLIKLIGKGSHSQKYTLTPLGNKLKDKILEIDLQEEPDDLPF
ncbi:hypothetical protein G1K97_02980 [Tenacibaculum finnmarkense]|uniref:hypothetical protein n=1 Tax=Tenacibaculum finnmarkense TaxID=2781243 RepID=UPI001EFB1A67|nr:hypothetical protein [Tenacibaculum finnmarkense]MCG8894050.1 hypothetical protein [Tenacibaculum finnmarkense]MCG8900806.1 hypothetical protein [Tenacibaculum finnmarkense]